MNGPDLATTLVQCVSVPRSGHHYLVRLLRGYFNPVGAPGRRMRHCEYYGCCRTRPCQLYTAGQGAPVLAVQMQKSHDEYLRRRDADYEPKLEVRNDLRHLVQISHPIPSTISEYRLAMGRAAADQAAAAPIDGHKPETAIQAGSTRPPFGADPSQPAVAWRTFAKREIEYRKLFLEKWVLQNPWVETEQYYFLDYDRFLQRPKDTLREAILFLCPDESIDDELIEASYAKRPLKPKRDPRDFEYADTLDEFESFYADTWLACQRKLGLDS